jgi:hypothetical protein
VSEIAVLIPTLGRADALASLVENIHSATHSSHRIYLVIEDDDAASIGAAQKLDAIRVLGRFGSCARAVNEGYRVSTEPYFAVGNDDCNFQDGWDVKALAHFNDTVQIVGLNDGSGDCKCFSIARRSYIRKHSGVYDKPDTPYHEYTSQCVDTEFAHYAMVRGVWADAHDAVLEHVHWRFGKADASHPNYVKARESNAADLETYARRRPHWDPDGITPMAVPGSPG